MQEGFKGSDRRREELGVVAITYAGHGTSVSETNCDEVDVLDEGLCTYDLQAGGSMLIDKEIHELLMERKSEVLNAAAGKPLAKVNVAAPASIYAKDVSHRLGDRLLAGCDEGPSNFQYAAKINGRPNGAFTYYGLKALKSRKTYAAYDD